MCACVSVNLKIEFLIRNCRINKLNNSHWYCAQGIKAVLCKCYFCRIIFFLSHFISVNEMLYNTIGSLIFCAFVNSMSSMEIVGGSAIDWSIVCVLLKLKKEEMKLRCFKEVNKWGKNC